MSTIKPVWTENQTITGFNDASLTAGTSTAGDIDLDVNGYDMIKVQVKVVFGGTPDGDVIIKALASPDSGTTDDTESLQSVRIGEATSATKIISMVIKDVPHVRIEADNNDTTDTINISAIYAGRKWDNT